MTPTAAPRLSGMRDYRKLIVWQKGHRLALAVYTAVRAFPRRGYAGLANQITRAAASIPATVAEACGKSTDAELARFTEMALASAKERENHLILARDLGVLDASTDDGLER